MYYVFDRETKQVRPTTDIAEWTKYFESADRHVAVDMVGPWKVSTVFLGVDYGFAQGEPILFETMVFDPDGNDIFCARYTTYGEAWNGHQDTLEKVQTGKLVNALDS